MKRNLFMKALAFETQIKGNQIVIPEIIQKDLENNKGKKGKVIILIEQNNDAGRNKNDLFIQQMVQEQFLDGYADSDSIYDKN